MTNRFASFQNAALSFVGAIAFAALMVSAAVPVMPIA